MCDVSSVVEHARIMSVIHFGSNIGPDHGKRKTDLSNMISDLEAIEKALGEHPEIDFEALSFSIEDISNLKTHLQKIHDNYNTYASQNGEAAMANKIFNEKDNITWYKRQINMNLKKDVLQ